MLLATSEEKTTWAWAMLWAFATLEQKDEELLGATSQAAAWKISEFKPQL